MRIWLVVGLGAVVSCSRPDADRTATEIDSVLAWAGSVSIEESASVMTVFPVVREDRLGGYLVADMREGQVRRYGENGRLYWRFGTRGRGPDQFEWPTVAIRLPSNEVLAVDGNSRLVILDSSGARVVRSWTTTLRRVEDADVLDDSTVLLTGRLGSDDDADRMHRWDYRTNAFRGSFFRPFPGFRNKAAAAMGGWVQASLIGDTVVGTFAPSDSLYFFTRRGEPIATLPLRSLHFRLAGPMPEAARADPGARDAWVSSFDLVTTVFPVGAAGFLVPYQTIVANRPVWKVMGVRADGGLWLDDADAPRLLYADPEGRKLLFQDPGSDQPNVWLLGALR